MSETAPSRWRRWAQALRRDWRSHLGSVLVAVAAFSAVQWWQTQDAPRGAAPDFTLPLQRTAAGLQAAAGAVAADGVVSLHEWQQAHPGRAVAVHIWSEWCPFCKAAESSVTRVAADWPVLTVAARSGDANQVARFMTQRGLNWVTGLDPSGDVGRRYGLTMVPVWLVVAPDGRISSVAPGYTTELGMRARLWWAQYSP